MHAERQRAAGVDLVIAQGSEAGGHTGEIGTMVLVPQVVDAVAPTPVLAAGGIADGRQIVAALALGAQGVWCGSVWLTTEEAETHPVVKEKFLAATSADTLRSRSKTGKHARQLRSSWTDEWSDPANPEPLGMPLQMLLVGEAEQRIARTAASNDGSRRLINYFVGQAVGMMNETKPATTVVFDLVEQYVEAAGRIAATIAPGGVGVAATIEEAAAIAMELPGVTEEPSWGNRAWKVGKKTFAWDRPFSKADLRRFGDAPIPTYPILAVRVDDLGEKEAVLAAGHKGVFTIPHFDGYAAVLDRAQARRQAGAARADRRRLGRRRTRRPRRRPPPSSLTSWRGTAFDGVLARVRLA